MRSPIRRLLSRSALRRLAAVTEKARVVALLELDSFDGAIPSAWLVAARSVDGEADHWLRRLVRAPRRGP
jgi:hypothetical protein